MVSDNLFLFSAETQIAAVPNGSLVSYFGFMAVLCSLSPIFCVASNNTSKTDVAPWCYKWTDWMDGSPGGVKYKAPYGANKAIFTQAYSLTKVYCLMLTV